MKMWLTPIIVAIVGVVFIVNAPLMLHARIFDVFGGFALGAAVVMLDVNFLLKRAGIM